jgi:hypothetical protein
MSGAEKNRPTIESRSVNMLLNICDHIARNQLFSGRCDFGEGQAVDD